MREDGGSGALGTHSVHKLAATHARRSGTSKDKRDKKGMCKGRARVGDQYDYIELLCPDIKIYQMLCMSGLCKYKVKDRGVSDTFILQNVVPNLKKVSGQSCFSIWYCLIILRLCR